MADTMRNAKGASPKKMDSTTTNNLESFFLGKFLASTTSDEGDAASIFRSWLQNRLREHFIKIERDEPVVEDEQDDWSDLDDPNFHSLKIIRILEYRKSYGESFVEGEPPLIQPLKLTPEDPMYEVAVRNLVVTVQRDGNSSSPTEDLHLVIKIGEIPDVELLSHLQQPFIAYSEQHEIDTFKQIFNTLQTWLKSKGHPTDLPIPTCYYARYEDHKQFNFSQLLDGKEDAVLSPEAMAKAIEKGDFVIESHRISVLANPREEGYKAKNEEKSSFMSLRNVQAALKEMAKLHAISWAYPKLRGEQIQATWPVLDNAQVFAFVKAQLNKGFPCFMGLAETFLKQTKAQDAKTIMNHLMDLNKNLEGFLEDLNPTNHLHVQKHHGPITLCHQGLNYNTVLFKNELVNNASLGEADPVSVPSETGLEGASMIKRQVCITDWACATYGPCLFDVASLLLTSLPPKTRQENTAALLNAYWEEFKLTLSPFGGLAEEVEKTGEEAGMQEAFEQGILYSILLITSNFNSDFVSVINPQNMEALTEALRDLILWELI